MPRPRHCHNYEFVSVFFIFNYSVASLGELLFPTIWKAHTSHWCSLFSLGISFFSFALTLSWHCLYYVFELLNFLFLFSLSTFLFGEHTGSYSCRLFSHFFANVHCTNENTPNIHKQKSIWALMESSSTADNFFSMANRCLHSAHEKHLYVCTRFVCHPLCRSCLCAFFSAPFCA